MLKELIYNYFKNNQRAKKDWDGHFAPSDSLKCGRQLYYKRKNITASNPISEASFLKMELGNATHLLIQKILKDSKIEFIEEEDLKTKIYQGIEFIYRTDGIYNIDGKKTIIEIKSTYSSGFSAIEHTAKTEHIIQALLYKHLENADKIILLYIGRDNGLMHEYHFEDDNLSEYETMLDSEIQKLKNIKDKILNNDIPDKDFKIELKNYNDKILDNFTKNKIKHKTDWQCSYCQWKNLCWEKELQEIRNHKFYIDNEFID